MNNKTCKYPDETSDPEIDRWKVFVEAAHGEKSWMGDRLNWLFIPQGFFFASLAWIAKSGFNQSIVTGGSDETNQALLMAVEKQEELVNLVVAIISFLGFNLAIAGFIGAWAAGRMHYQWTSELNTLAEKLNKNENRVSFGMEPYWPARSSSVIPAFIAGIFVFAWFKIITEIGKNVAEIFWGSGAFIAVLWIFIFCVTCIGKPKNA